MLMSIMSTNASAYDICVSNAEGMTIYYNYTNNGKELSVTYNGSTYEYEPHVTRYEGHIVIPEEVIYMGRKRKVTSIGDNAFNSCHGLTSITIPNSVTAIGERTFSGCSGLTSVNIPNSVTAIGASAFSACGLASVNIPNSVITIGEGSFYNCSRLKKINISNGVKNIDKWAFYGCVGLTSVNIPNSVINLGDGVFQGCSGMTSVTISNSVISIGEEAFSDCRGLQSVTIPNSVTRIGNYAFKNCRGLTSIVSLIENPFKLGGKTGNPTPFPLDVFNNATLYVPVGTIDKYKNTEGWKDFVFMEEGTGGFTPEPISEPQKCEKPTISYQNRKLIFNSRTEEAICQYSITDSDIKSGMGNEVELAVTYNISVYATKAGCENSEVATATLCWIDFSPKMEGLVNGMENVNTKVLLIKNDGGNLTIEGTDDGEQVSVYTTNGMQVGNGVAINGTTTICTNLQKGNIAVVKIGEKSVRVMVK